MKLRAFTLLEILVVLGIIGAMAVLSIYAMTQFRRTIQLSQATSELIAVIKETENLAKNNTLPKTVASGVLPYSNGYFLVFQNNNIYRILGKKDTALADWQLVGIPGDADHPPVKSGIFNEIKLLPQACSDGTAFNAILFINLTGDIMAKTATGLPNDINATCNLNIQHSGETSAYKTVQFSIKNDTYKVKDLEHL